MEGNARTWFTPKQKAELRERWKNGQCVADISVASQKPSKEDITEGSWRQQKAPPRGLMPNNALRFRLILLQHVDEEAISKGRRTVSSAARHLLTAFDTARYEPAQSTKQATGCEVAPAVCPNVNHVLILSNPVPSYHCGLFVASWDGSSWAKVWAIKY
jgi:hypothetical protein